MKPIIKFEARDGKMFDTQAACEAYEKNLEMVMPKMWSLNGEKITNPDAARLVYLGNYDAPLGANFIALCKKEAEEAHEEGYEVSYAGIEPDDSGWFLWDEWADAYHYIDDDDIALFRKVFMYED